MKRHQVEQGFVLGIGFLLGVALAVCIAPGDVFLWVLMGVVLGLFCREHFVRDWGGEMFGWFAHPHDRPPKVPLGR